MTTEQAGGRATQLALPGVSTTGAGGVYTSSFSRFRPEWGVPVAITVGKPGWFEPAYETWGTVAPFGLLDLESEAEFTRRYRHSLHRKTPRILRELEDLIAAYEPAALILLCFERPGEFCHRRLLAEWIEQKTGEEVAEL
jgi:hypothetical protein